MGCSGWREGVAAMNPLNGSSECLVFPECTWSEGWEITMRSQWSKNFGAMSTMWNTQVSRRSNRATRSASLANDSDCLLVGWAGSESFQQSTNKQPPTIAPSSHLTSNRLNSLRALASKVEETCAKHGEQFADHFGEKGIADRLKFSLRWNINLRFFRFRANLVVDGGEAFGEEAWSEFQIGAAEFKVGGPCKR